MMVIIKRIQPHTSTRHAWHYNRQAQAVRYADASGNVHHYDFDHAGRLNQVASWSHQTVGQGAMQNQAVFDYDPFENLSH